MGDDSKINNMEDGGVPPVVISHPALGEVCYRTFSRLGHVAHIYEAYLTLYAPQA